MPVLEEKLKGKKVVPILDPPRVGISKRVVAHIRKMKEVSRMVYVSSNDNYIVKNLLDLASSDKKSSFEGLDPFVVKRVIPMDVAPHTLRCEMIILCDRLAPNEIPKSTRSNIKPAKKVIKKKPPQRKNWYGSSNSRSNYFPTEDMVRRYSSMRKPKQEIDYQKRDSLYPPPLRGALYQGYEEESQYYVPEKTYSNNGYSNRRDYNKSRPEDLSRFNSFRQDMESALHESVYYTPGKQLTSRKLAYANALLEEGIRIASEVMDDGYPQMPSSGYYNRQKVLRGINQHRY